MKLSFPNREYLIGNGLGWLQSGLDSLIASIQKSFHVEHKADNTHGNIHADSLIAVGPIEGQTLELVGPPSDQNLLARIENTQPEVSGLAETNIEIIGTGANLLLRSTSSDPTLSPGAQILLTSGNGSSAGFFHDDTRTVIGVGGVGQLDIDAGIAERNRTTPIGEWISIPFSAGNFTGTGGMTVTVDSGDVALNRYALVGKTLTWTLNVNTFTLASANGNINVAIPGGFTAAQTGNVGIGLHSNNSGSWEPIIISAGVGASALTVVSLPSFVWTGAGTNTNYFTFTVSLEVQ